MRWIAVLLVAACGSDPHVAPDDANHGGSDSTGGGDGGFPATLDGQRDRLLASYLTYLAADPSVTQSNGLSGANVHSVCELWGKLAPSSQQTFTTITHRLYSSKLADGSHMLDHVTKLYRLVGGEDADATNPGSCGGGEFNRMIMQHDTTLHDALVAANANKGAQPYDLADVNSGGYWRDSHDLGGSHAPFDLSDETNDGAPRGQTQYFEDPASTLANTALGRMDLTTLVDPYALEMDQDFDCAHNSNPGCSYQFYGPACAPETSELGTQIYTEKYGDPGATWKPAGC